MYLINTHIFTKLHFINMFEVQKIVILKYMSFCMTLFYIIIVT